MKMSLPGRLTGLFLALGVSVSGAALLAPAASAAPSPASANALSFTPAKGLDTTPLYVIVPKPCPAQATNVLAKAVGLGFPAGGQTVVSNSTSGISHTAPFILPLQDSFTGFAADNGASLRGAYVVTLRCINRLGTQTYASFTSTITFFDAKHYTAPAPTRSVIAAIAASQNPASSQPAQSQPSAGTSAGSQPLSSASANGSSAAGASGGQSATPESKSSQPAPSTAATKATKSTKSSGTWQPLLVGIALLLILLAVLIRVREVRRERARAAAARPQTGEGSTSTESASTETDSLMSEPRA
jgi:hypothetical protein